MSDIKISDKTKKKSKTDFSRFLLGILMLGEFSFVDIIDFPPEVVKATDEIISLDPTYEKAISENNFAGKYRLYGLRLTQVIAVYTLTEWLQTAYGHGKGDCYLTRYVFPEFRGSKEILSFDEIIIYLGFKKGLFKKVYKIDMDSNEEMLWKKTKPIKSGEKDMALFELEKTDLSKLDLKIKDLENIDLF